ncbi:ABC transporter ATP-binding protein [Rhodococcus pseudokoreensis]|uniref:ABC transporter ATP-binding protein n=1 Tax=Rhodococcus pseudokoreensis TaxID=2811421 RepID=A0A974W2E1_9NOCA|nr:ABC transporter ATP-binding protein [Rhodococcus pseudokoreensis]QSE89806.1 ABC transporter ATP-binding protein [Rhodococcus pseudokoreensis]
MFEPSLSNLTVLEHTEADPDASSGPLLEVRGLRTELDTEAGVVTAVSGVDLTVGPGEALGIVGESGCGKSMTAFSIAGLLPPNGRVSEGHIRFDGRDLTTLNERELRRIRGKDIGVVFQDPLTALNPTMTIFDQVAEPLRLHTDLNRSEIRERVIDTMTLVGIPDPANRLRSYPHQLSGGLRQRVAIGIALVCRPKLLIADEPTTALDVTIQRQILLLIDRLRRQLSMSVILITHDLGVIAGHADRVVVMYAGGVAETAPTSELFRNPRHRYTEGLFAALPDRVTGADQPLRSIPGTPPNLLDPPPGCRFAPRCPQASADCTQTHSTLVETTPLHLHACIHPVETDVTNQTHHSPATSRRPAANTTHHPAIPALQLEHVVKDYLGPGGGLFTKHRGRVSAVADVSLTVPAGETFGLVGESGCGKSTLARMMVALEEPTSGRILVSGADLTSLGGRELRRRRRDVHLMFQDPSGSMNGRRRGLELLREPFAVQGIGERGSQNLSIAELFDMVGLPRAMADRYPHELSGGQRQRLALARALALGPKVVVADEPVSALDVSIQAQILNLMKDLQRERGLSYVFVSHDLSVVQYISHTIGVMYLGKLVEVGAAATIYSAPAHPYTRALLDSAPVADPDRTISAEAIVGDLPSATNPPSGCRFRKRCPLAQDVCAQQEPLLREVIPGQRVACHFPLTTPAARIPTDVEMPSFQQSRMQP